jgi:hypothetical protein
MFEAREVVCPREHLRRGAVELAEPLHYLRSGLAGALLGREKAPVEALQPTIDASVELAEAALDLLLERGQRTLEECAAGARQQEKETAENGSEQDESECVCHPVYKR